MNGAVRGMMGRLERNAVYLSGLGRSRIYIHPAKNKRLQGMMRVGGEKKGEMIER
jgi:hypothetical protein